MLSTPHDAVGFAGVANHPRMSWPLGELSAVDAWGGLPRAGPSACRPRDWSMRAMSEAFPIEERRRRCPRRGNARRPACRLRSRLGDHFADVALRRPGQRRRPLPITMATISARRQSRPSGASFFQAALCLSISTSAASSAARAASPTTSSAERRLPAPGWRPRLRATRSAAHPNTAPGRVDDRHRADDQPGCPGRGEAEAIASRSRQASKSRSRDRPGRWSRPRSGTPSSQSPTSRPISLPDPGWPGRSIARAGERERDGSSWIRWISRAPMRPVAPWMPRERGFADTTGLRSDEKARRRAGGSRPDCTRPYEEPRERSPGLYGSAESGHGRLPPALQFNPMRWGPRSRGRLSG